MNRRLSSLACLAIGFGGCGAPRSDAPGSQGALSIRHGSLTSSFPEKSGTPEAVSISNGRDSLRLAFDGLRVSTWDHQPALRYTARGVSRTPAGDAIAYLGAARDIDLRHETSPDRHTVRLSLASAPPDGGHLEGVAEWTFHADLGAAGLASSSESLPLPADLVVFDELMAAGGRFVLAALASDAQGSSHRVRIRVRADSGGRGEIGLQLPYSWLRRPNLAYPIRVDLVVAAGLTGFATSSRGLACTATECEDGNPCTLDICDPAIGCVHRATNEGASCWGTGICAAGACVSPPSGGAACVPSQCEDGNPCTADACGAGGACVHNATNEGASCWGTGICRAGACVATPGGGATCVASWCEDGNPCTADACTASGACAHTAANDGASCWGNGVCAGGGCVPATGPAACVASQCEDGNPCTTDTCDVAGACVHTAANEGATCWSTGVCRSGTCVDMPPSGGMGGGCQPSWCEDGNPCTADACGAGGACTHSPSNEGATCWGTGTCRGGLCVDMPPPGGGGPTCAPSWCEDGNPCTSDSCDPAGRCTYGTANQGQPCWGNGYSENGVCRPPAPGVACAASWCEDGNPCTADFCDASGACAHSPTMEGATCWGNGVCRSGACVPGNSNTACMASWCEDGNPCTADACNASGGCARTPTNAGGACWTTGTCDASGSCTF